MRQTTAIHELHDFILKRNKELYEQQQILINYFEINYGEGVYKTDLEQIMLFHKIIEVNSMNINQMQMVTKLRVQLQIHFI